MTRLLRVDGPGKRGDRRGGDGVMLAGKGAWLVAKGRDLRVEARLPSPGRACGRGVSARRHLRERKRECVLCFVSLGDRASRHSSACLAAGGTVARHVCLQKLSPRRDLWNCVTRGNL